ncbi:MAG: winged helix-turn-helix transcriptional regulator [Deltaproteobacteria bacterium]|nr:winged helix-turn-helix transcriptional regulator [Deltaproteobacteria bacterium]
MDLEPEEPLTGDNYADVAFLAKSLSDENRLRILFSVSRGKKPVSVIVKELHLSQPLVSHHLKELRHALLVQVERRGPFVYYEMADRDTIGILKALSNLATRLLAHRDTF